MKSSTHRAMVNVHAWTGILIAWILYAIFISGGFSLFLGQTKLWEHPELRHQTIDVNNTEVSIEALVQTATAEVTPHEIEAMFVVLPSEHRPRFEAHIEGPELDDVELAYTLDGALTSAPHTSTPFELLFELHWQLLLGTAGVYIAGFAAFFMLLSIATGIIIHWRRWWSDLFSLRGGHKPRRFWIDVHNILGVVGIPFQTLLAFTGAFFNLLFIYQITVGLIMFGGDQGALLKAVEFDRPATVKTDVRFDHTGLNKLLHQVDVEQPSERMLGLRISNFGDETAMVTLFTESVDGIHRNGRYTYDIATGEPRQITTSTDDNPIKIMTDVISGLHFGDFGGPSLRVAYFMLSLATAIVIMTGIVIWLSKRVEQQRGAAWFNTLLSRLSIGFGVGLWAATAALLTCCHILPMDLPSREATMRTVFLSLWASSIAVSALPLSRQWV